MTLKAGPMDGARLRGRQPPTQMHKSKTKAHGIIDQQFLKIYLCDKASMRHLGESEKTKKKIRFPIHTIINTLPSGKSSHFQGHQGQTPFKVTYGLGHLRDGWGTVQIHLALLGLSQ